GQSRRSPSLAAFSDRVGEGSRLGATNWGDRGDWIDVTPRRRKAFRQDDRSYDRQRRLKRHGGERSWSRGRGFSGDGYRFCSRVHGGGREGRRDSTYFRGLRFVSDVGGSNRLRFNGGRTTEATSFLQCTREARDYGTEDDSSFGFKRFVAFYFTNFPEHIQHFNLKKAFEVCGILENVHVASKRNVKGCKYGFARFSNVRDVTKLLHAINDISFDQLHICAKVERFDKSYANGVERGMTERG
ncbi:RNA recognition motif, partial [Trifolium medium]|nr:RNA recognition motif [Trifolium medium]